MSELLMVPSKGGRRGTSIMGAPPANPKIRGKLLIANDLRCHRKLHQMQVHGLRRRVSGRLLPRGAEHAGDRPRRVHRLQVAAARRRSLGEGEGKKTFA